MGGTNGGPEPALTRRRLLARAGAGGVGLTLATALGPLSPAEARAQGVGLDVLGAAEGAALGALGETLLPGAEDAGIALFVDHQLGKPDVDSLLMYRYLDVPTPALEFYRGGLAAVDALAQARHGRAFAASAAEERAGLVAELMAGDPAGWAGPPAPLLCFVVRGDALDVVYGTPAGFARLGVPYSAHIMPEGW